MKLKNLFFVFIVFACSNLFAQETFPPSEVVSGTYKGLTIPLRDFPTMTVTYSDPKAMTMVLNESNTAIELNNTTTVIQNLQTEPGKIVTQPIEQNFVGASASESGFSTRSNRSCRSKSLCSFSKLFSEDI